jgi:hypothetical protein
MLLGRQEEYEPDKGDRIRFAGDAHVGTLSGRHVGDAVLWASGARRFHKEQDYAPFERVAPEVMAEIPTRHLGYRLMPNHWHLAMWPTADDEPSRFVGGPTHKKYLPSLFISADFPGFIASQWEN